MTIVKQLVQLAAVPLAMAAGVALCLWILLGVVHIEQASYPVKPRPAFPDPTVAQIQAALVRNGYSIGPAGAVDGVLNEGTLTALLAFQDNNALPVQPMCDRGCWTVLGAPGLEAGAAK